MIVDSAIVKHRTYEMQMHEIRVKIINMINQEKIIKNLQNANAVLHQNLKIVKIS